MAKKVSFKRVLQVLKEPAWLMWVEFACMIVIECMPYGSMHCPTYLGAGLVNLVGLLVCSSH
jgi:hypothetical protein